MTGLPLRRMRALGPVIFTGQLPPDTARARPPTVARPPPGPTMLAGTAGSWGTIAILPAPIQAGSTLP